MANNIRIGRVSNVNYDTGMIRVTYTDKGKSVSTELPFSNQNSEYFMPEVGEYVQVNLLSNGTTKGVVLGTYWGRGNKPPESGKGIYRKDFSKTPGTAMMRYDDKSGELLIKGANVHLNGVNEGKISAPHIKIESNYDASIEVPEIDIFGEQIEVKANETDIITKLKSIETDIDGLLKVAGKNADVEFSEQLNLKAEEIKFDIAGLSITFSQIIERIKAVEERVGIVWP